MPVLLLLAACVDPTLEDSGEPAIDLPGHNECLPDGQTMQDDACLAVVEDQGRYPTVSENKSGDVVDPDDPRQFDPEYVWLTTQARQCTCSCCHTKSWGGAGVYFWDLDYKPVWTDSASMWSLSVFAGLTDEYVQTLPVEDIERVRAYYDVERERRNARAEE